MRRGRVYRRVCWWWRHHWTAWRYYEDAQSWPGHYYRSCTECGATEQARAIY